MLPCLRFIWIVKEKQANFEKKTQYCSLIFAFYFQIQTRLQIDHIILRNCMESVLFLLCMYILQNTKVASNSLFRYKLLPREAHHQNHHLPRNFRQIPINDHRQRCTAKDLSYKTKMINHRHLQDFIEEVKRNWKLDQENAIQVPHLLITVHQQFLILKLKNL